MTGKSGWFVLTGRPCSGISTTARVLGERGFRAVAEAARAVIDEGLASGRTVEEIRGDDSWFQREILRRKRDVERELRSDFAGPVVFDRALPDSIVYFELAGLDPREVRQWCQPNAYRLVFFLEPLPYQQDYARTEDSVMLRRLELGLFEVYRNLGYEVVRVPADPVPERVRRIEDEIDRLGT